MRILFTTNHVAAPSTVLNEPNLRRLGEIEGVTIDCYREDYANYDVVIFMGYDPDIAGARRAKNDLKIGVLDPRPVNPGQYEGADFILANGIEMRDRFAAYAANLFIYYIYPELSVQPREHKQSSRLILGYHGNKVHLQTMYPYVTTAIEALAEEFEVELWAIYNVEKLGSCHLPLFESGNVKLREIQWSQAALAEYVPQMDIGLVPNLIPIPSERPVSDYLPSCSSAYNEHETDIVVRYKATCNAGRILVFSQCGIPVVADMVPSALDVLRDGETGFVAASAAGWYWALRQLAGSVDLRTRMGKAIHDDYINRHTVAIMNRNLVKFISCLPQSQTVPSVLQNVMTAPKVDALQRWSSVQSAKEMSPSTIHRWWRRVKKD